MLSHLQQPEPGELRRPTMPCVNTRTKRIFCALTHVQKIIISGIYVSHGVVVQEGIRRTQTWLQPAILRSELDNYSPNDDEIGRQDERRTDYRGRDSIKLSEFEA